MSHQGEFQPRGRRTVGDVGDVAISVERTKKKRLTRGRNKSQAEAEVEAKGGLSTNHKPRGGAKGSFRTCANGKSHVD